MTSALLPSIRVLLRDSDPENRLLGLVKAEAAMLPLAREGLTAAVQLLREDPSRVVAARAKRVFCRLGRDLEASEAARNMRPLLAGITRSELALASGLEGASPDQLRRRVLALFRSWLERLAARLESDGPDSSICLVDALGRFAWVESVKPLLAALEYGRLAEPAVRALTWMSAPEAQRAILSVATRPSGPMKVQALEALGSAPQVDPLPVLGRALEGTVEERQAVCRALARLGNPRGWKLLCRASEDKDSAVAVEAIRSMAKIGDPSFAPALVAQAGSGVPSVRATVAAALGQVVAETARDVVTALCGDRDHRVRANAVQSAISYCSDHKAASRFFKSVLGDPHHRVRATAVTLLWPFDREAARRALRSLFDGLSSVERATGYWCAGRLEEEETVRWLADALLHENDPKAAEQALIALSMLHQPDVLDPVKKLMSAPWPAVRARACAVFAQAARSAAVSTLSTLMRIERDPKVRSTGLRILARLSPPDGLSLLPGSGDVDSDRIIANVVEGLGESGQAGATSYLKPMLLHRASRVRATALVALVGLGDLSALDALESLWNSAPASACWALRSIGELLTPHGLISHPRLGPALFAGAAADRS